MWIEGIIPGLKGSAPFTAALSTYGLFHFLDRKASGPAKRALTKWLGTTPPAPGEVRLAVVGAFDSIYTAPLFTFRAAVRSFVVSISLFVAWQIYVNLYIENNIGFQVIPTYLGFAACNLISDYMSLFLVRRCLLLSSRIIMLILSAIVGWLVVCFLYALGSVLVLGVILSVVSDGRWWDFDISDVFKAAGSLHFLSEIFIGRSRINYAYMPPALVVHCWILLLAMAILIIRFTGPLFSAVRWAQWFIKSGKQHPFDAVGVVAALLVLIATATVQLVVPNPR